MRDSELDEMSADDFNRKYKDTLTEIKAQSMLKGDKYGNKPNNIVHPENRAIIRSRRFGLPRART